MKYIDPITKEKKTIYTKASDTLPLGAIVDFDGEEIPAGWEPAPEDATVYIGPNEPTDGQDIWIQKGKNLIDVPYTSNNKLTITANKDDDYTTTDFNCYLEAGKTYAVSFESDGEGGGTAGTDTVQIWLLKDKEYTYKYAFSSKAMSFTPGASGYYYLRVDVNKNAATHSFWNIQIEHGDKATEFEPYLDKKIYIKNQAGSYDLFVKNRVHIGPYQPEDGEEVWIRKSGNLFDKNTYEVKKGQLAFDISKLNIGDKYTISSNLPLKRLKISDYGDGYNSTSHDDENGFTSHTFTLLRNAKMQKGVEQYLFLAVSEMFDFVTDLSELDGYEIKIEKGDGVKPYEPYVKDSILIKNSNGAYVNIDVRDNYTTAERIIGKWIDGKPIYQKIITYNVNQNIEARYEIKELDRIIDIRGMARNSTNQLRINHYYLSDGVNNFVSAWSSGKYIYSVCSDAYNGYLCDLIVEYTKTTD